MNVGYPYRIDQRRRTATSADARHVRDMVEQVLLTRPGERVNRPTFGSGLMQMVFTPNNDMLAHTLQMTAAASLQHWLGDIIEVQDLEVESEDARLAVLVRYVIRETQEGREERFSIAI